MLTLFLGGTRSGKSRLAEDYHRQLRQQTIYIATARAEGEEMQERIALHRDRRPDSWPTIEVSNDLAGIIVRESRPNRGLLIDCLTLWLSTLILDDSNMDDEEAKLLSALNSAQGPVSLVSNEVGLGLVPETPIGRRFRDAQGELNQAVANICDRVVFVAAGLPMILKGPKLR